MHRFMVAAMLACVAFFSAAVAQDEQNEATVVDDDRITTQLETIFKNVDDLDGVSVHVDAGVVRLEGSTTSDEHRQKAEAVAKGIDGVVYVDNEIAETTDVTERLAPSLARFNELLDTTRQHLPLYGVALALILGFLVLAKVAGLIYKKTGFFQSNSLLHGIVGGVLKVVIVVTGIYLALEVIGATAIVGAVIGAAGVVGLALSFAFRDIIENYLASIFLSLRHPFNFKDSIEVDGIAGKVVRMTASETMLLSADGNHIRLPNSNVFKGKIVNFSRNPERRFEFTVGIGSDEDISAALERAVAALRAMPSVLADPPPSGVVSELGDSSVALKIYGWMDQSGHDLVKVRSSAIRIVKAAFDDAGIAMPAPQYEINLHRNHADGSDSSSSSGSGTVQRERERAPVAADAPRQLAKEMDVAADAHLDARIDEEALNEQNGNLLPAK